MAAIDDVIEWAKSLPLWQADAVRRFLQSGEAGLSPQDEKELLALAKDGLGLKLAPDELKPILPSAGMFSGAPTGAKDFALVAIEDVQNVNAIQSGKSLHFSKKGLTIVYGNNGAGKSGFTRILKLSCSARDKDEKILTNVFAVPHGPPTATITIEKDGQQEKLKWIQGVAAPAILANISAFDARCARLITDEKNEITYLPYGADVFEKLGAWVGKIKTTLEGERKKIAPLADSAVTQGTKAAKFLDGLTGLTEESEIEAAANWGPVDDEALGDAEKLLTSSSAATSATEVAKLARLKQRIDQTLVLTRDIKKSLDALSNEACQSALMHVAAAKSAHQIALDEKKIAEPLPGVATSNPWKSMYAAAKLYSEQIAYPAKEFPVVGDGALCVLCQQELSAETEQRFQRFKKFMEDQTAAQLASVTTTLGSLRQKAVDVRSQIPSGVALDGICEDVRSVDVAKGAALKDFFASAAARTSALESILLPDTPPDSATTCTPFLLDVETDMKVASDQVTIRIGNIEQAAKPEEFKKLQAQIAELRARKALSTRKADIKSQVSDLKKDLQLTIAIAQLKTNEITKRGTTIINKNLTPELIQSLQQELKDLGVDHLPMSVHSAGSSGETLHELRLEGVQLPAKVKVSQVLSEGETRVIAVAGFLAELALRPGKNPIVLDDPVSSLDHVYTGYIARRLAREALHRQVIVFTHNIAFLMEIQDAVDALGKGGTPVKLEIQTLRRFGAYAGVGAAGVPWHAMKVKERAAHLEDRINKIKPLFKNDMVAYNKDAAEIYGLLREAWESSVEEDVFYTVVSRYRNSIKTMQLMEVEIEDKDVLQIDLNMTRCSTWMTGHDKSKGLHDDRPSPTEMLADIKALRDFSTSVIKRRDATKQRRKALTKAS